MKKKGFASKKKLLQERLRAYGKVLVAFSGGKDSFYLLKTALETLGKANVFPYFVHTSFISSGSLHRVAYLKKNLGIQIKKIYLDYLEDKRLSANPRLRCYYCKMKMFRALRAEAKKFNVPWIVDGSTNSDLSEHRPGRRALAQLNIRSPLQEASISSEEIVQQLRKKGMDEYFLTSSTCLATRFPYGHRLQRRQMDTIGQLEAYLSRQGIFPLRVRHMEGGVRIETSEKNFPSLLALREGLIRRAKRFGLRFLTLDLEELRSGCWD